MVAIGQALMSRPTYLLLDAPASGVAPFLVDEIYDTIERLVHDGLGMVLVDQGVERSGRYYVMDNGSMVLSGESTAPAIDQINPILLGTGSLGQVPASSTPPGLG
jgi:branched-chain amino acid transport system ATP-binding protein